MVVACGQTARGVSSACTPSTAAPASPCGTVSSTFSPSFGPSSAYLMAACHHLKPFASRHPCHAAASSSGSRCCLCRCRWRHCTHTTGSSMPSVRRPSKHVACGHMYRATSCRTTTSCEPASAALVLLCRPRRAIRRLSAPFCTKVGAELSTVLPLPARDNPRTQRWLLLHGDAPPPLSLADVLGGLSDAAMTCKHYQQLPVQLLRPYCTPRRLHPDVGFGTGQLDHSGTCTHNDCTNARRCLDRVSGPATHRWKMQVSDVHVQALRCRLYLLHCWQ